MAGFGPLEDRLTAVKRPVLFSLLLMTGELSGGRAALPAAIFGPGLLMLIIERVSALNKAAIFAGVQDHALAEIAQIVVEADFDTGEKIIREGDDESWMFILVEGTARVDIAGKEVATIGPGAAVGELAVLDPGPRAATVTALTPCLLFRIDRAAFFEVMEEQPSVPFSLLVMLTRMLRAKPREVPVSA